MSRKKKERPLVGGRVPADGYCSIARKRMYATEEKAKEALAVARRRGESKGGQIEKRVYQCPWCSGWHLTSQEEEPS